ncbi:hypothetical protein BpHYR1_019236 [Brachionus plicatilis]|uniref:Uncharacterized protein n=1 Tax=Brachionus plicatilis TaxID=10195 RepID=A0A3M7PKU7_BRAPC|nr:hypothetical protein BpHYR1_019236 [Brachionus plicatilis]
MTTITGAKSLRAPPVSNVDSSCGAANAARWNIWQTRFKNFLKAGNITYDEIQVAKFLNFFKRGTKNEFSLKFKKDIRKSFKVSIHYNKTYEPKMFLLDK